MRIFVMFRLNLSQRRKTGLAVTTWIVAVGTGLVLFLDYETAPGKVGVACPDWPATSPIPREAGRAQLVLFAHPRCPCTRASLRELAHVMTDCQGLVEARVLFFQPRASDADWRNSDLWQSARAIPGVQVAADPAGVEQERFGVETSGHVLLYNAAGKLVFSGGITSSRGHSGESAGRTAIVQLLRGEAAKRAETFVFGCPLCQH